MFFLILGYDSFLLLQHLFWLLSLSLSQLNTKRFSSKSHSLASPPRPVRIIFPSGSSFRGTAIIAFNRRQSPFNSFCTSASFVSFSRKNLVSEIVNFLFSKVSRLKNLLIVLKHASNVGFGACADELGTPILTYCRSGQSYYGHTVLVYGNTVGKFQVTADLGS